MKSKSLIAASIAMVLAMPITTQASNAYFPYSDGTGYYIEDTSHLYPLTGIVTEIEADTITETNCVTITCANGNEFAFYAPTSDCWELEDLATCIMDSKGTEIVYDDEIIMAQYAGGIKQFEQIVEENR